jgi:hypothetical protein
LWKSVLGDITDYVTRVYFDFISYLGCVFIILLIVLLYKCVVYCPRAKVAWEISFTSWLKTPAHLNCTWETLKLKQCLFNPRLHSRLKNSATLWSLLKGFTMWCIWLETNNLVFNGSRWHNSNLREETPRRGGRQQPHQTLKKSKKYKVAKKHHTMVTQSTHDCNLRRLFWESLLDHG